MYMDVTQNSNDRYILNIDMLDIDILMEVQYEKYTIESHALF